MRFKQFLHEKPMNPRAFADVGKRLGNIAKVGFEFEMLIPKDSYLYASSDNNSDTPRATERISWYDTLEEFDNYFVMSSRDMREIENDYESWKLNAIEMFVERDWDEYVDDDNEDAEKAEKDAREKAENDFPHGNFQFGNWIKTEFGNNYEFVRKYSLEPRYGWYDETPHYASVYVEESPFEESDDFEGTFNAARESLFDMNVISDPIIVSLSYHGAKKDNNSWYIEPDGSIDGAGHGMELVSPPMILDKATKAVDKIFAWMNDVGAETNSSTGLHINVSMPNLTTNLDSLKLVLFMGEKYAAEMFGRRENTFAKPQIDNILKAINYDGRLPSDAASMEKTARKYLSQSKYSSVNFAHFNDGYLEFRVAGGINYESDKEAVKNVIYRFVAALESACDPKADRKEYLKKLVQLFNTAGANALKTVRNDIDELPAGLHRLYKYSNEIKRLYDTYKRVSPSSKKFSAIRLADRAMETVHHFKTFLDIKEKVFIKKLLKDSNVTSADIDKFYQDEPDDLPVNRLNFKKELGI